MTYSSTVFLAIVIHIILHFNVIRNMCCGKEEPYGKAYRGLTVSIMVFYICDALWGILYEAHLTRAVELDTILYFCCMAATAFFWIRFVIYYMGGREKNRFLDFLSMTGWLLILFFAIILVLNLFFPIMFWFDSDGVYHAGNMRYVSLVMQILLFVATAFYAIYAARGTDINNQLHCTAIGAFGIIAAIIVVVQVLFPLQPLYTVGLLFGTCILHTFVIQDMEIQRRFELDIAKRLAYTDSLTGVNNTHAYVENEKLVDSRIARQASYEFGVVVFDLNDLKKINDTKGHDAGDEYIKKACRYICEIFNKSPVFRVGGDEFVAFLEGEDYRNRDELLEVFETQIEENLHRKDFVIASGLAVFRPGDDDCYRVVFERADQKMYDRKVSLKSMVH